MPVDLGTVTAPSGTPFLVDPGYLNLWCDDGVPRMPAGVLSTPRPRRSRMPPSTSRSSAPTPGPSGASSIASGILLVIDASALASWQATVPLDGKADVVFWGRDRIFKDPMTTAAAIDRLVHHAVILERTGGSVRAEAAKMRGDSTTITPTTTTATATTNMQSDKVAGGEIQPEEGDDAENLRELMARDRAARVSRRAPCDNRPHARACVTRLPRV